MLAFYVNKNFKQMAYLSLYVILLPLVFLWINPRAYAPMFAEVLILALVWVLGVYIAYLYLFHKRMPSQSVNLLMLFFVFVFIYPFATQQGDIVVELVGGIVAGFLILYLVNFKFKKPPAKILRLLARGSFFTYTFYLIHFPILLLTFSCLGERLLAFHWSEFLGLAVGLFLGITVISYYLAKVLENRDRLASIFAAFYK